jgi:hypothetical protein
MADIANAQSEQTGNISIVVGRFCLFAPVVALSVQSQVWFLGIINHFGRIAPALCNLIQ